MITLYSESIPIYIYHMKSLSINYSPKNPLN